MNPKKGFVMILVIPAILLIFCLVTLLLDISHLISDSEKTQLVADMAILSIINTRADSLQQFALQQKAIEAMVTKGTAAGLWVPRHQWPLLLQMTSKSKNALSGYKGRLTSIITVLLNANGYDRQQFLIDNDRALKMNIEPQSQWVFDEKNKQQLVSGLWYKRSWSTAETAAVEIEIPSRKSLFTPTATFVPLKRRSQAMLEWDGVVGTEGYPGIWTDTIRGQTFRPYPAPYYRSRLWRSQ